MTAKQLDFIEHDPKAYRRHKRGLKKALQELEKKGRQKNNTQWAQRKVNACMSAVLNYEIKHGLISTPNTTRKRKVAA